MIPERFWLMTTTISITMTIQTETKCLGGIVVNGIFEDGSLTVIAHPVDQGRAQERGIGMQRVGEGKWNAEGREKGNGIE